MKKSPPTVSVILPCYNGEQFIHEAIASVLNQTFKDLEIIVVDDGSTDDSVKIIETFLGDKRVRLLRHSVNRGIPATRNTGIKDSSGSFISFLDQDDLWLPGKLEKQLAVFENDTARDVGLVFSDIRVLNSEGRSREHENRVTFDFNSASRLEILRELLMRNFIPIISALIRSDCFDKIGLLDEEIKSGADDYDFCVRLAMKSTFVHMTEVLAVRREHGSNYTNLERLYPDVMKIVDNLIESYPSLAGLKNKRESTFLYQLGMSYCRSGIRDSARKTLKKSIQTRPCNVKAILAYGLCSLGKLGNGFFKNKDQSKGI
jgi:glycosyltransferase involved in cell wall biosynthesis